MERGCVNEVDPYLSPFTAGSFSVYPIDSNGSSEFKVNWSKVGRLNWTTRELIGTKQALNILNRSRENCKFFEQQYKFY